MNSTSEVENALDSLQLVDKNTCPLSSLPKAIRWKIFGHLTESVGELRLVSKSWLAMVDEWAIPCNLPEVVNIDIHEVVYNDLMHVNIAIRRSEAACFQRLRELANKLIVSRDNDAPTSCTDPADIRPWKDISFLSIPYDSSNLSRLRDAISVKARLVDIIIRGSMKGGTETEYDHSGFYKAIAQLLEPLKQAKELRLYPQYIDEDNAKILLDLTKNIAIRDVDFAVDSLTYPRDILCSICERVECIRMKLYNYQVENVTITTSLRDKSASWVELILAMFHAGASSIVLSNYFVDLFSSEDIRRIGEALVSRRTPFHFQVILHERPAHIIVKGIRKTVNQTSGLWMVNIDSATPQNDNKKAKTKNSKT